MKLVLRNREDVDKSWRVWAWVEGKGSFPSLHSEWGLGTRNFFFLVGGRFLLY